MSIPSKRSTRIQSKQNTDVGPPTTSNPTTSGNKTENGQTFVRFYEMSRDLLQSESLTEDLTAGKLKNLVRKKLVENGTVIPPIDSVIQQLGGIYQKSQQEGYGLISGPNVYNPDTKDLITIIRMNREEKMKLRDVASLDNIKKYTKDRGEKNVKIAHFFPTDDGSWKVDCAVETKSIAEFERTKTGFIRDLDMRKVCDYSDLEMSIRDCMGGLSPLSPPDLCSQLPTAVPGLNTIYGYYKYPRSLTRPHVESASLLSVNVNLGPGSSTWYALPLTDWYSLINKIQSKGLNAVADIYWPDMDEMRQLGYKPQRIIQNPGDIFIVNPGTVHYVEADEPCDQLAWNLALPSLNQLVSMAITIAINETYGKDSDVPEQGLLWAIANDHRMITYCKNNREAAELYGALLLASLYNCSFGQLKIYTEGWRKCYDILSVEHDTDDIVKCDNCRTELYFHAFCDGVHVADFCWTCITAQRTNKNGQLPYEYHCKIFRRFDDCLKLFIDFNKSVLLSHS